MPAYETEQEQGLFYIVPMKQHVSVDEHICSKFCLVVALLPCTYTAKGSRTGHDKTVLLQAGWQHFTLANVGTFIFRASDSIGLHPMERRELHNAWQLFPNEECY